MKATMIVMHMSLNNWSLLSHVCLKSACNYLYVRDIADAIPCSRHALVWVVVYGHICSLLKIGIYKY